jgi:3-deoxy-7-phosphoheptulonate synthase
MQIFSPSHLRKQFPLSAAAERFIASSRDTIRRICLGKEQRLLIIAGPCSIHDPETALEYARRFKSLSEAVKETCFLVMRAYVEKPRTHTGWRGLVHDPWLNESYQIEEGLSLSRQFLTALAHLEVPTATEFVTPSVAPYFQDLISWGCIGARTSSSQIHRLLASHLPMPIGFKNSIDGNIDTAISGVVLARQPQVFLHTSEEGHLIRCTSKGNLAPHIVLRGSQVGPNCDKVTIDIALNKLRRLELPSRLIVDCSHGNCQKRYERQREIFLSLIEQIQRDGRHICGLMLESYLEAGAQSLEQSPQTLLPGVSVTDPCLDFDSTAELIEAAMTLA